MERESVEALKKALFRDLESLGQKAPDQALLEKIRQGVENLSARAERAEKEAAVDFLTGLASRRVFMEALERALLHAKRGGIPVMVAMIDLDGFKAINDQLGHSAGDQVLRLVAARISKIIRGDDLAARLGGDEFVLLLHASPESALKISERIRTAISAPIKIGEKQEVRIGVSIGLAPVLPTMTIQESLNTADQAMYEDKKRRNGSDTSRS